MFCVGWTAGPEVGGGAWQAHHLQGTVGCFLGAESFGHRAKKAAEKYCKGLTKVGSNFMKEKEKGFIFLTLPYS